VALTTYPLDFDVGPVVSETQPARCFFRIRSILWSYPPLVPSMRPKLFANSQTWIAASNVGTYHGTQEHTDTVDPPGRLRCILALARYTARRENAIASYGRATFCCRPTACGPPWRKQG
jgi:hypothetical protein